MHTLLTVIALLLCLPVPAFAAEAKAMGMKNDNDEEPKSLYDLQPKQREEAEAKTTDKARANLSVIVRSVLFWIAPVILFGLLGTLVGFSTAGRTIFEAAIGSAVGQTLAFLFLRFGNDVFISYIELGAGIVGGVIIAGIGAYVGEAIQEKRERATLDERASRIDM